MEKTYDDTLQNVPFPFDPGIEIDATEDTHSNEVQAEEETTKDDSESQDVSEESLDFQPDAPSVVVCCYCRNTSPAVVPFLTTRRVKSADLNEHDSSLHSDLSLTIVTEIEVKENEAREPLDAYRKRDWNLSIRLWH